MGSWVAPEGAAERKRGDVPPGWTGEGRPRPAVGKGGPEETRGRRGDEGKSRVSAS